MILVIGLVALSAFYAFPQILRKHALSLQTDNDSYLMIGQDQYYTNGLIFTFDKLLGHSAAGTDRLSVQLGHQLFNGSEVYGRDDLKWDRPSTGYFFLNTQFQRVYTREWLWRVKAEVGTVGEAAKGKQIQQFVHRTFRMYEVESWESDLKSAVGLDLEASVFKKLWRNRSDRFEISGGAMGRGGMNFSYLSSRMIFRAGRLAPYTRSHLVGNGGFLSDDTECYFFYSPGYIYQLHNTTIQGVVYAQRNDEMYDISKHVFFHKVGFAYSHRRFSIEAAVLFNTKEGQQMYSNHQYAQIKSGFRF
ncbi:lipid A-modifier LpxR family protein [Sphingobacterium paucimobilis]|nr:lipid A-modifier LpxR family protein [Sphingobacterium paucimobilis]